MTVSSLERARERAHTDEARERRRETWQRRTLLRNDVELLYDRGLVPMAISDKLGVSDRRVAAILSDLGIEVPSYLTLSGPPRERRRCPHCGRA